MLKRVLRLIAAGLCAYRFHTNPLWFIISALTILLLPYLTYIFWGSLVIIALAAMGLYFTYKVIRTAIQNRSPSY